MLSVIFLMYFPICFFFHREVITPFFIMFSPFLSIPHHRPSHHPRPSRSSSGSQHMPRDAWPASLCRQGTLVVLCARAHSPPARRWSGGAGVVVLEVIRGMEVMQGMQGMGGGGGVRDLRVRVGAVVFPQLPVENFLGSDGGVSVSDSQMRYLYAWLGSWKGLLEA